MNSFLKKLTVDRDFAFNGQIDDFRLRLDNLKGLNHKIINEREIKFWPFISLGTLAVTGWIGLVDGINVRAHVSDSDTNSLKVNIKTKVRPEHYFIIVMFLLITSVTVLSDESKWLILYDLGLWIICHAWFQLIYRLQENYLIDKVTSKLKLVEM